MLQTIFRALPIFLFLMLSATYARATHNRAGEIIVEMVRNAAGDCGLTVKATIVTYTKTSSTQADRDSLTICWGAEGPCERVGRSNGPGSPGQGVRLENDIKYNTYEAFHTYDGPGTYVISFRDPNRNEGVINVNFPNSVSIEFYIENVFTIVNPVFSGCNNSPILQVPPIDFACLGEVFTHNPGAYDIDGDSLAYELTVPRQSPNNPVPNFFFPPGLSINRTTGDLVWDSPNQAGEYNIAINVISFRNGLPLDTMVRDMQIIVRNCANQPPVIDTDVDELCVIAGSVIDFPLTITAPIDETNQRVRLLAYGAPFNVANSPAEIVPPSEAYFDDPLVKRFRWATTCDHISNQPYNVVFRAVDNFLGDTTGLATLKTIRIKVVGPPPEDVQVLTEVDRAEISWALPYTCEDVDDDYFRGFSVWRRVNSNQFTPDTCVPGLDGQGYIKITSDTLRQQADGRYFFVDETIERGRTYCYRVLANFARRTANGLFFYNPVPSLPSTEVCMQLGREVSLLVKVDVTETDATDGRVQVCWTKPDAADLDTLINGGPYTYELLRAEGHRDDLGAFTPVFSTTSPTFAMANDTCFLDTGLNTVSQPYTYIVRFYVNGSSTPLGAGAAAGSIFLNAQASDRMNTLTWDEFVPWENFTYTVFRENTLGGLDSIAEVMAPLYRDEGLINGQAYCYVIRASGTYNIDGLPSPLVNRSQRVCSTPVDNIPPCPPVLIVRNGCDDNISCEDIAILENTLQWEGPQSLCPEFQDADGYYIYYAPTPNAALTRIATVDNPLSLTFTHQPEIGIAGCYAVSVIDTVGNESALSNIVCVDNCPSYELPNAFTPNGDGQNDVFKPTKNCFVASVSFQVFNRWGGLVFETADPALNWNGKNTQGNDLEPSTYFYRCQVLEQRVEGIVPAAEVLSGYIELIRGVD